MTGLFIALEGGEGAGKSTQAKLLAEVFEQAGAEVVLTREPGATDLGRQLRELLLTGDAPIGAHAEALMYAADRSQHVIEVIQPALERGAIVITDRYAGSSIAYQGAGRGLGMAAIARLAEFATGNLWPNITVLLDIDPAEGLQRAGRTGSPDRLESEALAFHRRVRAGFRHLADEHDWIIVDAGEDPSAVHEQVVAAVRDWAPA